MYTGREKSRGDRSCPPSSQRSVNIILIFTGIFSGKVHERGEESTLGLRTPFRSPVFPAFAWPTTESVPELPAQDCKLIFYVVVSIM